MNLTACTHKGDKFFCRECAELFSLECGCVCACWRINAAQIVEKFCDQLDEEVREVTELLKMLLEWAVLNNYIEGKRNEE